MTKQHIEFVLSGYGVPFTDALADKLLEMFDEEAASYQHTINELNKALSENKGDLISRQAVLDIWHTSYSNNRKENEEIQYKKIAYELPPVENKGEWIPISERLPEKNMVCIVAVGRLNITQMARYSDLMGIIDHRIFWQGDVGHDNFVDITEYVKAWQPLPEPYKENET